MKTRNINIDHLLGDVLELADIERYSDDGSSRWPDISARIPAWHPRNEDDDEDEDEDEDEEEDDKETDEEKREREERERKAKEKKDKERERKNRDKDDDDEDDDEDKDEYVRIPKAQYDKEQREKRQQAARAKKAEKEAKERREKEAANQGKFEELATTYKDERDEAIRERDEAREELKDTHRKSLVEKIAKRVGFVESEDAWLNLQRQDISDEEWDDPQKIERKCKAILRDKPHLKGKNAPSGAPKRNGGTTLTMEEIEKMSEEEINERWPEVSEAMAANGAV